MDKGPERVLSLMTLPCQPGLALRVGHVERKLSRGLRGERRRFFLDSICSQIQNCGKHGLPWSSSTRAIDSLYIWKTKTLANCRDECELTRYSACPALEDRDLEV